jgi:hypothetical protein
MPSQGDSKSQDPDRRLKDQAAVARQRPSHRDGVPLAFNSIVSGATPRFGTYQILRHRTFTEPAKQKRQLLSRRRGSVAGGVDEQ